MAAPATNRTCSIGICSCERPNWEPDGRKARVRFCKGGPLSLQRHSGPLLTRRLSPLCTATFQHSGCVCGVGSRPDGTTKFRRVVTEDSGQKSLDQSRISSRIGERIQSADYWRVPLAVRGDWHRPPGVVYPGARQNGLSRWLHTCEDPLTLHVNQFRVRAWRLNAMTKYFLLVKIFSRGRGSRVTRAAAYRAGERIRDERTSESYNYSKRKDIVHSEIILPSGLADHPDMEWRVTGQSCGCGGKSRYAAELAAGPGSAGDPSARNLRGKADGAGTHFCARARREISECRRLCCSRTARRQRPTSLARTRAYDYSRGHSERIRNQNDSRSVRDRTARTWARPLEERSALDSGAVGSNLASEISALMPATKLFRQYSPVLAFRR